MGTTEQKLSKLSNTKAAIKSAINGSGSTVGDVFSEYPTAITSGKSVIAQAITDKGVETAVDATFEQMAENIGQIETGGAIESAEINYTISGTNHGSVYVGDELKSPGIFQVPYETIIEVDPGTATSTGNNVYVKDLLVSSGPYYYVAYKNTNIEYSGSRRASVFRID